MLRTKQNRTEQNRTEQNRTSPDHKQINKAILLPQWILVIDGEDLNKAHLQKVNPESQKEVSESVIYSTSEFENDIEILGNKIIESKVQYDGIIAVTRGGIVPAGYLSQQLSIKKIYTCGGYFSENGEFEFINHPQALAGRYLLVSDLCKSGETLQKIIEKYNALKIRSLAIDTVCMHYFPLLSKVIKPKYYANKVDKDMFIKYPWEC